ncbi:MAG: RluA family pseudouridine synthase [Clostridiales bacterium]|jgi:23S rRNA pseudouridine955/2504/2580 synthase|nr:RluA family pseudouridine synthase [Clostridiales bacterium]
MNKITVLQSDAGRRLDKYLIQYLNAAPRSLLYKLLRKKRIKLNGKKAEGGELLAEGDVISLYLSPETVGGLTEERKILKNEGKLDIVHEDEQVLIVNKPAGLPAHGGMQKKGGDTLMGRALYYLENSGAYDPARDAAFVPALCNRLDVNTSGLVVCGKTSAAVRAFNSLFAEREIEKEYLAVVHGELKGRGILEGTYEKDGDANIAKISEVNRRDWPRSAALPESAGGIKPARVITAYEAVKRFDGFTLLKVLPVTGRSHQIRAHLAASGYPIVGDVKYGGRRTECAPAQLLHCAKLTLMKTRPALPYEARTSWYAPPPEGFNEQHLKGMILR